jgi:hypothetical protein
MEKAGRGRAAGSGFWSSAAEVREDATVGHVIQVSGTSRIAKDAEATALEEIRGALAQFGIGGEILNSKNRVVVLAKTGTAAQAQTWLMRQAWSDGERDLLRAALNAGAIEVKAAEEISKQSPDLHLFNGDKIRAEKLQAALNVNSLTILALNKDDWDVTNATVTLLVMLAGNVVKDAVKQVDEEIKRISFIKIQA